MKRRINIIGAYVLIAIGIGLAALDTRYAVIYLITLVFNQLIAVSLNGPSEVKKEPTHQQIE